MAVSRRTVTVLFADVADSTPLGERLDPEALRQVMSRWFERMSEVLERHGGTVEKFIGDAVMAVFGIPELHEDDALRAGWRSCSSTTSSSGSSMCTSVSGSESTRARSLPATAAAGRCS
jgi:class 3 adenylate cyclase